MAAKYYDWNRGEILITSSAPSFRLLPPPPLAAHPQRNNTLNSFVQTTPEILLNINISLITKLNAVVPH
jgi:hypothetical protein